MKSILFATLILASFQPVQAAEFELKDGDKVVWLGSTLIEREQRYGHWEAALTARWPERNITFRNLAWSGDNVYGEARLAFDVNNLALGLKRMVDLTLAEKPTVIFICYGANESFEGEAGLPRFEKGLENLLNALKPAKARIVLFSPTPFEADPATKIATDKRNVALALYRDAIRKAAEQRTLVFADLYSALLPRMSATGMTRLTDNGQHFTEAGYAATQAALLESLGLKPAASAPDREKLRQAIVEKNRLYFYRWRPQNETYLFGFRKHEQGRNAKEVAEFDPLVAKAEEEIASLRMPKK